MILQTFCHCKTTEILAVVFQVLSKYFQNEHLLLDTDVLLFPDVYENDYATNNNSG